MFINFSLGLRDIWKNIIFFLACVLFLVFFCFVIIMIIHTIQLDREIRSEVENAGIRTFDTVYTTTDFRYEPGDLIELSNLFEEDVLSYRRSKSLTDIHGRPVYLLFGDAAVMSPSLTSDDPISVFGIGSRVLPEFEMLGLTYEVQMIEHIDEWDWPANSTFVLYQGSALTDVIDLLAQNNAYTFFEIMENITVSGDNPQKIGEVVDYIENEVQGMGIKGRFDMMDTESEARFLTTFLYPLVFLLSAVGVISFVSIYQRMLQQMRKELTIHLHSGARFYQLLFRFMIFFGAIILLTWLLLDTAGLIAGTSIIPVVSTLLIISMTLILYIVLSLRKMNLHENLRGDLL